MKKFDLRTIDMLFLCLHVAFSCYSLFPVLFHDPLTAFHNFQNPHISGGSSDIVPPQIFNCPSDIRATTPPGTNTIIVSWIEPTAEDDSGSVYFLGRSHAPYTSFNIGLTTVTYTFADEAGNIASCTFNIIVSGKKG